MANGVVFKGQVCGGAGHHRAGAYVIGAINIRMPVSVGVSGYTRRALYGGSDVGAFHLIQVPVRMGKGQALKGNIMHTAAGAFTLEIH